MTVQLIRVPCDDGREYDLYLIPPIGMSASDVLPLVELAIEEYFGSSGELELIPLLEGAGFRIPEIYDTEGTW